MSDTTYIPTAKVCDLPHETAVEAKYDGRMLTGQWANLCEGHWSTVGCGRLGTGYGQRLIVGEKPKPAIATADRRCILDGQPATERIGGMWLCPECAVEAEDFGL
jgi:ribosomal protein L37AE/L43A